ncbi:molybdopterin-binding protein [Tannockella kyphosi]|uniref:molybdopterin-binding protein n=1 Tax=Tannockella kyphosi TaxID=2899121 RepID=UPI0020122B40|nr:molybdopterin-binding protein [Tannockella kyphosi]
MKSIKTVDAVGQVLYHDITQIIRGVTKDVVFSKGHLIKEEDIPVLLSVGKDHIYICENDETMLHENDAAEILKELAMGSNIVAGKVKEGKIELIANCDGLLCVHKEGINAINSFGQMMIASRHGGFAVKKGDKLAGTRIIPLVIEKEKMEKAKETVVKVSNGEPLLNVIPFQTKKYGVITTGNEIYHKRIQDTFTPVIQDKLAEFGGEMVLHEIVDDDFEKITLIIQDMLDKGVDMIICTGGMSVDPDDKTPLSIKNSGATIITYGAPVLPGAMFLMAYSKDNKPIMGLPGCVMYAKRTIFDLVLPKVMADVPINREMIDRLGEGGLCLGCDICTFPNCGFGK